MFGKGKNAIKITPALYERIAARAKAEGAESVDAYVAALIERDVAAAEEKALRDQVLRQMKSLGYME